MADTTKRNPRKTAPSAASRRQAGGKARRPASEREYLAIELGHSVDADGEPIGLDFPSLRADPEFRQFTTSIVRQFQSTRAMGAQMREMEQEGLGVADLWAPGITEFLPTTSTPEDVRRYKQKLLFRANLLEAILTETVAELKRLDRVRPIAAARKRG